MRVSTGLRPSRTSGLVMLRMHLRITVLRLVHGVAHLADPAGQVGAREEGGLGDAAALNEQVHAAAEVAQQEPRHCRRRKSSARVSMTFGAVCV